MPILIGIDVGQKRDPTAICVAEPADRMIEDRREVHFLIRYLERLPLGTPYPKVAEHVRAIAEGARRRAGSPPHIYVDATGVGKPVVDLLVSYKVPGTLVQAYFTHGDRRTSEEHNVIRIGKAFLVSRLQMLFQSYRLHLPRTAEAEGLREELKTYEIRVDEKANDRYGAFRVGTHDDLVTALGLAVQDDHAPTGGCGPLPWFAGN